MYIDISSIASLLTII